MLIQYVVDVKSSLSFEFLSKNNPLSIPTRKFFYLMNHKGKKNTKFLHGYFNFSLVFFVSFLPLWFIIILKNFLVKILSMLIQ
jgi:hypothetical protein